MEPVRGIAAGILPRATFGTMRRPATWWLQPIASQAILGWRALREEGAAARRGPR